MKPSTMLNPVPVVMVSSGTMEQANIITIAWAGTICSEPPMVSSSVRPERHSYGLIQKSGEFVINLVTEDDVDDAFDRFIYDYSYVDDTITESAAFICVEAEVPYVQNRQIKNMRIYVTVACHKRFMEIDTDIIGGTAGNRRDNLIRYIDKELNDSDIFGIGRLSLKSVKTLSSTNQDFSVRELCYDVPDFNLRRDLDENRIR